MDRGTRVEGVVQVVIMLLIGAAAAAASFTHVHGVAADHGQSGWLAWADAVVLELMSVAAGLELRHRRRGHEHLWFPAVVLTVAVVLSLGAQVVEAQRSVIGWLAAALPAAGFLTMVKIALGRTSHVPDVPDGPGPPDNPTPSPNNTDDEELLALLPAASQAAADLAQQGRPLSRGALAEILRGEGHAMSNARASALVKLIRDQSPEPAMAAEPVTASPITRSPT